MVSLHGEHLGNNTVSLDVHASFGGKEAAQGILDRVGQCGLVDSSIVQRVKNSPDLLQQILAECSDVEHATAETEMKYNTQFFANWMQWDATRTVRAYGVQDQAPPEQNDDGDDMAMTIQAIDNTLAPIDILDDLLALAGV